MAINWENLSHATAFLLGAALATVATLRIVKHITTFFASVKDRSPVVKPLHERDEHDDEHEQRE